MRFGNDENGTFVDLVATPGEPRITVGKAVAAGLVEDYRADLTRRSQPVRPDEARAVALQLARLHPSQRRQVLAARRDDVGKARFRVEANAIMRAASELDASANGPNGRAKPVAGAEIAATEVLSIPAAVQAARADDPYYAAVLERSGVSHPDSRYGAGSGPRLSR